MKDFKNKSDAKRKEALLNYGKKLDETVGAKYRVVKGWFFKIFGALLMLIGVFVLLAGGINAGLGILGVGFWILGMGLNLSMMIQRIVIATGLVILGSAFVNYGFGQMAKAKESVNWPSAAGKILSSEQEKRTSTEGNGSSKETKTYYVAVINYEYQVDGKAYTSNRIGFAGQSGVQSSALVNKYPKGKSVSVFYCPNNPEEAVLEKGGKKADYFFPVFGGFIILFGLFLAYKGNKANSET